MHTAMTPAIGIPASLIERISYTAIDIGTVGHCGAKQGMGGKMALDRDIRIRSCCVGLHVFSARRRG